MFVMFVKNRQKNPFLSNEIIDIMEIKNILKSF